MHARSSLPDVGNIADLLRFAAADVSEHRGMWPRYWLKLAAVQQAGEWRLIYLGVAGRFSSEIPKGVRATRTETPHLLVVSHGISRRAWEAIRAGVVDHGSFAFERRTIMVPDVQAFRSYERLASRGSVHEGIRDVLEPRPYLAFTMHINARWEDKDGGWQDLQHDVRSFSANDVWSFISQQFGLNNLNMNECTVALALPLDLAWAWSERNGQNLTLRLQTTRRLGNTLRLRYSLDGLWSDDNPKAELTQESAADWGATIPKTYGRVWIQSAMLYHVILLESPRLAQHDDVELQLIGALYAYQQEALEESDVQRGLTNWRDKLKKSDAVLEVAALNGFARLGYLVLYGGTTVSTPDFDMIVVDPSPTTHRIALLEVTGSPEVGKVLSKSTELSKAVARVASLLERLAPKISWQVRGAVLCALSDSVASTLSVPSDVTLFSAEDVRALGATSPNRWGVAEKLWPVMGRAPWLTEGPP